MSNSPWRDHTSSQTENSGQEQEQKNSQLRDLEYLSSLIKNRRKEANTKEENSSHYQSKGEKDPLTRLRELLLIKPENQQQQEIEELRRQVTALEKKLANPQEIINLLAPIISKRLTFRLKTPQQDFNVSQALEKSLAENPAAIEALLMPFIIKTVGRYIEDQENMTHALIPIIDRVIQSRTEENKDSMSAAIAPVLPSAITEQARNFPQQLAQAIAPEMAAAIRKQIDLESEAMADALYPVIGDTMYKAIAETMREINTKVETALSPEGISRKIRARLRGVSEAELLLAETMGFAVRAIFLIHKQTGLLIANVQQSGDQALEPDMVAGMLTAIRSFVGEYLTQSGKTSEIDEINYGNSKIILEVAGSVYLAVVIDGEPSKSYLQDLRQTFSQLLQKYGEPLEEFAGDPETVSPEVHSFLEKLLVVKQRDRADFRSNRPPILIVVATLLLGAVGIGWGINFYQNSLAQRVEDALLATPELSVYRLDAEVRGGNLRLEGRVPSEYLRRQADQVAQATIPNLPVKNEIIAVDVPPGSPVAIANEVERLEETLNRAIGTAIEANYEEGQVNLRGSVLQESEIEAVSQAFSRITGVKKVVSRIEVQSLTLPVRFYFQYNSSQLQPEAGGKVQEVKSILALHPEAELQIAGYTYGGKEKDVSLGIQRATVVKEALVAGGVAESRLEVAGSNELPPGVKATETDRNKRAVVLTLVP